MKNLWIFSLLIAFVFLQSCNQDSDCIESEFEEYTILEEGNEYCFPNGDFFEVKQLQNAFCPCDVICVWEGEMLLHYKGTFGGIEVDTFVGSSENTDKVFASENYEIHFFNIEFELPCSESIPSPDIVRATAVISQ